MPKLTNWWKWLDTNLIKILVVGFIFIIPLYPKFPLQIINYTYIAIRLDDLYLVLINILFFIQLLRKRIDLNTRYLKWFILFWIAIFASFFWGTFIQHTIAYQQLGFLNTMRRLEYMSIFFIAASSIRSKKDLIFYLNFVMFALLGVCLYGLGQKFFGFPAVSTMNAEFALGHLLYLTPEARVSSTFAGHYDLAAYLVLLIPVTLALYNYKKNVLYFLLFIFALFLLVLTASRSSFISYLVSAIALLIYFRKFKQLIIIILITIAFSFVSTNLTERFMKVFQVKQIFVNPNTGEVVVPQTINTKELPAGDSYIKLHVQPTTTAEQEAATKELQDKLIADIREEAAKSHKKLTASEEAHMLATMSAGLKPVNTVVSDISFSTRLKVEWPRAINAFLHNPILGAGASAITESTDGDYFRWLGEFGALGTTSFLLILFFIVKDIWSKSLKFVASDRILFVSFIAGLIGLMLNATYIDVFEASKVAYYLWLLAGIFTASVFSYSHHENKRTSK